MTNEPTAALQWVERLEPLDRAAVVELVHALRRGGTNEFEETVVGSYEPYDCRRQLLRQAVRYLAETPEIDWPRDIMAT